MRNSPQRRSRNSAGLMADRGTSNRNERLGIIIVDDHPVVCSGLVSIIGRDPSFAIVGQAHDFRSARSLIESKKPDLLLVDLLVDGVLALDFIREMKDWNPAMSILVMSMMQEGAFAARCARAGSSGYITKSASDAELLGALRQVARGGRYFSSQSSEDSIAGIPEPDGVAAAAVGPGTAGFPNDWSRDSGGAHCQAPLDKFPHRACSSPEHPGEVKAA